jgi:hypothetical protein
MVLKGVARVKESIGDGLTQGKGLTGALAAE